MSEAAAERAILCIADPTEGICGQGAFPQLTSRFWIVMVIPEFILKAEGHKG